ncbi:Reverse transcriptase-like [Sesbania bispinosa]|nr:Reverse transcriptase-like [Sesbania bispinosa]
MGEKGPEPEAATEQPQLSQVSRKLRGKGSVSNAKDAHVGKTLNANNEENKFNDQGNKFSLLSSQRGKGSNLVFNAASKISVQNVPSSSNISSPLKMLTRKKRPRKEPHIFQPKIVTHATLIAPSSQGEEPARPTPTSPSLNAKAKIDSSPSFGPSIAAGDKFQAKSLPSNIQTVMEVEYVGPNRLRFVDEPKPPDLNNLIGPISEPAQPFESKVLIAKYGNLDAVFGPRKRGSQIWSFLQKTGVVLKDGFHLKLGNGNANFWDVWHDGQWNLQQLYTIMQPQLLHDINSLSIHLDADIPDTQVWHSNISGEYSVRDGYCWLLKDILPTSPTPNWNWVWKLNAPENVHFLEMEESISHCFLLCPSSTRLWGQLGILFNSSLATTDWIQESVSLFGSLFLAAIWVLWCHRNKVRASNIGVIIYFPGFCQWIEILIESFVAQVDPPLPTCTWCSGQPCRAGWVLRDHNGKWIYGYMGSVSVNEILLAELMAILTGIKITWKLGFRDVICNSGFGD